MGESVFLGVFAVVLAVVGAGQLYVGLRGVREVRALRAVRERALPVTARVTASDTVVHRDPDGDRVRTVLTTVQFEDRAERTHTVQVALPRLAGPPQPGRTVDVLYDPENPVTVLPASGGHEWFVGGVSGIFVVIGAGLLVGAAVLLLSLLGVVDLSGVFGGLFAPEPSAPQIQVPGLEPDGP